MKMMSDTSVQTLALRRAGPEQTAGDRFDCRFLFTACRGQNRRTRAGSRQRPSLARVPDAIGGQPRLDANPVAERR